MKKLNILIAFLFVSLTVQQLHAQRYLAEEFDEVTVTTNQIYGANATILTYSVPTIGQAVQQPLAMDIYEPVGDTETARPLILYFHTGNFLPFPENGGTGGTKSDSSIVEIATRLAKMGYVVASCDYRLGWNPIADEQETRVFTLINAAYRGVQDARTAIRYFKKDAAENNNTYKIDPNKIILWGQGTGGYIALATACLDEYEEVLLPKFTTEFMGQPFPMIIEAVNGDIEGKTVGIVPQVYVPPFIAGDTLCYPNHVDYDSDFQMAVNLGGALGDSTWHEDNVVPIVSFQVPTDPFAPYMSGLLIVPGFNLPVVDVVGSYVIQKQASEFGNHSAWIENGWDWLDPYTEAANVNNNGYQGLYPLLSDDPAESAQWDFYAEDNPNATTPPDPVRARLYIDTIINYFAPRACITLDLGCDLVAAGIVSSLQEITDAQVGLELAPNPADRYVRFTAEKSAIRHIYVYDMNARLVSVHNNVNSNSFSMPRQDLTNGMYFVQIRFDEGFVSKKIVFN